MSQETRISPGDLEEFLGFLADDICNGIVGCMGKGWQKWFKGEPLHKSKPSEIAEVGRAANYVVMALQMGLLLAKRQPELEDVALSILKSKGVSADELWHGVIETYQGFLVASGCEYSERNRISSEHFEEFLAYFASRWLREMSKLMDKEWQNGWGKRGNPFKLKPGEKAKIARVGNQAALAILAGLLIPKRQPELLGINWSRGASLDVLWKGMLKTYRSFKYYKVHVETSSKHQEDARQKDKSHSYSMLRALNSGAYEAITKEKKDKSHRDAMLRAKRQFKMRHQKDARQKAVSPEVFTFFLIKITCEVVKDASQALGKHLNAAERYKLPKVEEELIFFFAFSLDCWIQQGTVHTQEEQRILSKALQAHLANLVSMHTLQERLIAYARIINEANGDDEVMFFGFGMKLQEFCGVTDALFLVLAPELFTKAGESLMKLDTVRLKLR